MKNNNIKLTEEEAKLQNYVSEDGTYLLPVGWEVYATIRVKGDNLLDALRKAQANQEEIPLSSDPQYVDDSYKIDTTDLVTAQEYADLDDGRVFEFEEKGSERE